MFSYKLALNEDVQEGLDILIFENDILIFLQSLHLPFYICVKELDQSMIKNMPIVNTLI
jgi:hypothetical protein